MGSVLVARAVAFGWSVASNRASVLQTEGRAPSRASVSLCVCYMWVKKGPKRYSAWVSWSIRAVQRGRVLHTLPHPRLDTKSWSLVCCLQGSSIDLVTVSPVQVTAIFAIG